MRTADALPGQRMELRGPIQRKPWNDKKDNPSFTITDQDFDGLVQSMKSMLDEDLVPHAKPA